MKKISFTYKREKIDFDASVCDSLEKFLGLMFKFRENARVLLFEFKKPTKMKIHSFFVFFPFIAVWLDDKNKVIGLKEVKPFTLVISPEKYYSKLIEIPLNRKYIEKVKLLVGD